MIDKEDGCKKGAENYVAQGGNVRGCNKCINYKGLSMNIVWGNVSANLTLW